jgi:hypothetical protein
MARALCQSAPGGMFDPMMPAWRDQQQVTLYLPMGNSFAKEQEADYAGLRWYAAELARTRAFTILADYHRWFTLLCGQLQQIAASASEVKCSKKELSADFMRANSYLHHALEMDCLFGKRGIDFFKEAV